MTKKHKHKTDLVQYLAQFVERVDDLRENGDHIAVEMGVQDVNEAGHLCYQIHRPHVVRLNS